jgi:YidC/Oxa1 family membrane protein insertase
MSNWGPIKFLANLLQPVLAGIDGFVHDWGLAVILLTLLVRLVLFPLTIRQARFAYRNRNFSKAYKEVQAKFKDKPEKLKEEAIKLQMEHKFNPLGMMGTLILQMPIFAAVYAVFYHFGSDITSVMVPWAESLSKADPMHVLPFLAAGLSAVGALVPIVSPETAEGVNASTKFTPILIMFPMMLFFLWKAPVAIALYMSTSTLWGMVERRFLRSPFAVQRFTLNPAAATAATAVAEPVVQKEPGKKKKKA